MKIIFVKIIAFIILAFSFAACQQYEVMKPLKSDFKFSYERSGSTTAIAGTPFNVIFTGSGEFVTLYSGLDSLSTWGNKGAKGVDFNNADSLQLSFSNVGTYKVTVVVTSTGEFGNVVERDSLTKEVKVIDNRNLFTSFTINGVSGIISKDNEIQFSEPDATTDFNFKATFALNSSLAKVYVLNGTDKIEQKSGTTVNDFNPSKAPVKYIVKSANGEENQYTVKFSTFVSSSEKKITKFVLKKVDTFGNGEVGVIDEANKTINVVANYGSPIKALRLDIESSYGSRILLNGTEAFPSSDATQNYNIATTIKTIKVVAQNNTEQVYTLNVSQPLFPVESFVLLGLVPAPTGVIDNIAKTITINVLSGSDITKLTPKWNGTVGKVMVTGLVGNQINGVSVINFTAPKSYKFYSGSTSFVTYVVTVVVK
jgi:hypothetical protein